MASNAVKIRPRASAGGFGLQKGIERHGPGRSTKAVSGQRTEGKDRRKGESQHAVNGRAQQIWAEDEGRAPRVADKTGQHQGAQDRSCTDQGQGEAVSAGIQAQPVLHIDHQQGAGGTGGQCGEHLPDSQGTKDPVTAQQRKTLTGPGPPTIFRSIACTRPVHPQFPQHQRRDGKTCRVDLEGRRIAGNENHGTSGRGQHDLNENRR